MAIYKYLMKEYLEKFKEKGTLRIGNIEYYREVENKNINDPHEGRTTYNIFAKECAVELSVDQVNAITNDYHTKAALQIAPHSFFASDLIVPNAFTFSASCRFDKKLMKSFGYDACYKITDIKQFMNVLYNELSKRYQLLFPVAGRVRYVQTKIIDVTNSNKNTVIRTTPFDKLESDRIKDIYIEDYFTKPEAFKEEEEFRLIFVPATPINRKSVDLNCRKLIDYCVF